MTTNAQIIKSIIDVSNVKPYGATRRRSDDVSRLYDSPISELYMLAAHQLPVLRTRLYT